MSNLAEILAPTRLDQVLGQDHAKKAIASWIEKDNFPRCQLYTGPVGTGKSTLAGIVARACQGLGGWEGSDIRQINAGVVGKVDDMRALTEEAKSVPFVGRYRVFILEEAQRVTDAAADALLVPMETCLSTVWILTSSEPAKLPAAIRSRCAAATFDLKPLTRPQIHHLVCRALPAGTEALSLTAKLDEMRVNSPREILGVLDQYLAGVPLEEAIHGSEHEPLYKDVASAVLSGKWTTAAEALKQIKTADSRGLIAITSAFFRQELLKNSVGPRADALSKCLRGLDGLGFADGTAYGAATGLFYECAKLMGAK